MSGVKVEALYRAVMIVCGILPAGVLRGQASMFRAEPAHSGFYDTPGVPSFGGLQWRVLTAGPVRGSPTVVGNTVYVGSSDGAVYAIDSRRGDIRWRRDVGSPVSSTPAVANGLVFVTALDGTLRAMTSGDGRVMWRFRTGPALPLQWGFESGETWVSSPTVVGGRLLFGSRDGNVYALDAATGAERWRYAAGSRVYSSPAVAGGTVFVGGQDGTLHAIQLADGRAQWRFDTEGKKLRSENFGFDRTTIQSSPAVVDGVVYVGARDGWVYAVDALTGREKWRVDHKVSWINSSPAVNGGIVYVGSSDGHFIQAIDATTGQERWRAPSTQIVWSSPAVDRERVYVGEGDGTLYALDKATGKEVWRYRCAARIMSSPVIQDGRLYFGSDDGSVYAVNAAAGAPLARAVFWDSAFVQAPLSTNRTQLRDFLRNRGYAVLDAAGLARFLTERVSDRAPSVVVFAMDHLPSTVAPIAADTVLARRYLDAGGTLVWLGAPPLIAPVGIQGLKDLKRDASWALLGVSFSRGNFDPLAVTPNDAGRRAGLAAWYLDSWAANREDVTTVLATDEQGQAAAWVKSFGGPAGSGFVRFFAGDGSAGRPLNLVAVQAVAEMRPRR
jgi:eukaryotic-like serine/threonine-protein kinase